MQCFVVRMLVHACFAVLQGRSPQVHSEAGTTWTRNGSCCPRGGDPYPQRRGLGTTASLTTLHMFTLVRPVVYDREGPTAGARMRGCRGTNRHMGGGRSWRIAQAWSRDTWRPLEGEAIESPGRRVGSGEGDRIKDRGAVRRTVVDQRLGVAEAASGMAGANH